MFPPLVLQRKDFFLNKQAKVSGLCRVLFPLLCAMPGAPNTCGVPKAAEEEEEEHCERVLTLHVFSYCLDRQAHKIFFIFFCEDSGRFEHSAAIEFLL